MDIWTERLERGHLPILARWIGRGDGALTPNDLPEAAEGLARWHAACAAEPGRIDCLTRVYETPVGLAGLRRHGEPEGTAALYLLLGEVNYNPLRTATYVTLRMLDRAFLERGLARVRVCVRRDCGWYTEVLARMGFSPAGEREGLIGLQAERADYLSRKYLF